MSFDIGNVMFALHRHFPNPLPSNPSISRHEQKVADHLASIIKESYYGDTSVEESEYLVQEEYGDWEPEVFEPYDCVLPDQDDVLFGEKAVSREELDKAITFYRSGKIGSRPITTMHHSYRWIRTDAHMNKLRKYEKDKKAFQESVRVRLAQLTQRLYEEVKEKLDNGVNLHDSDLMAMALEINTREMKLQNFKASQSWITRWKQSHRIVSRRVTKFVTRKCLINKDAIKKNADDFFKNARTEISNYHPSMVFNCDQTGIQKELYPARSLAFMGEKTVERLAQSKSSLTHSFTFLPMIFLDGSMGPKAFMVIAEPKGQFPPSRPIPNCPNLEVRAGYKTHIMTKQLMCDFFESCVFIPSVPKKLYIMLDSWPAFKDHTTIKNLVPNGHDVVIRNIPEHTTGMIQPLDVYWNAPWKSLIKKFTAYALRTQTDYVIAQRNNAICMVSVLYHQISAEHFRPFLQHCWKKAGYVGAANTSSTPFLTPAQYCIDHGDTVICYHTGCNHLGFIRCARCKMFVCFNHFVVSKQHLCSSP
nr:hypothetical protein F30F8.4 - Caenorhabditis elegans [Caenorhabditis elegans]